MMKFLMQTFGVCPIAESQQHCVTSVPCFISLSLTCLIYKVRTMLAEPECQHVCITQSSTGTLKD